MSHEMVKLKIDGKEVEIEAGSSVIQACEKAGVEIPRFCYHDRLKIAGNCRMCLVEIEGGPPKPVASCAMPISKDMSVRTNSEMVIEAREGVMEFLLINHPLDCPICDQGGECDLQDQSMKYGNGFSRFNEEKRAVEDKYMGPLIKTNMTRCIHCTRCIRFIEDVAGIAEIGSLGRGEDMEIGTYVEQSITSEVSGNIIDLCPVGALTSRPYAFVARPWELRKTESIDVHDAVGCNIRVDSRNNAVLRVLPKLNDKINGEWISDKARFACDGLRNQRLDNPYIRSGNRLIKASWDEAIDLAVEKISECDAKEIYALAGDMACVESMVALKDFMKSINCENTECRIDGAALPYDSRGDYLFNTKINGISDADLCLFVGADVRLEASIINLKLRERYLEGNFKLFNIGTELDLTYPVTELGNNPQLLEDILKGNNIANELQEAKNPMMIIGQQSLARTDGKEIYNICRAIADKYDMIKDKWNGFNMLHNAAARVGGLDINFVPGEKASSLSDALKNAGSVKGKTKLFYLLGVDGDIDYKYYNDAFVIYQGHHGDIGAQHANLILPASAYTEKNAIYVNLEGRVQTTQSAVAPPGLAREDWKIIREISERMDKKLPYDNLIQLRKRIFDEFPFLEINQNLGEVKLSEAKPVKNKSINKAGFNQAFENFYLTNSICNNSKTMSECIKIKDGFGNKVKQGNAA